MSKFRGFIAIDIEPTEMIERFLNELKKAKARMKLVEPQNLHITLKFLGDTDENDVDAIEDFMRDSVSGLKPFKITLKGTGVFPNPRRINVIWIGMKDDGSTERIFQKLDKHLEKLGYRRESRKFSPHLTVARVKSVQDRENLVSIINSYANEGFGDILVESIRLKKSVLTREGPIYSTVRDVRLEG